MAVAGIYLYIGWNSPILNSTNSRFGPYAMKQFWYNSIPKPERVFFVYHTYKYSLLQDVINGMNPVNGSITNLNFTNPKIFSKKCVFEMKLRWQTGAIECHQAPKKKTHKIQTNPQHRIMSFFKAWAPNRVGNNISHQILLLWFVT